MKKFIKLSNFRFSIKNSVPTYDLDCYLKNPEGTDSKKLCESLAEGFHKYGAIAIKDPRIPFSKNEKFLSFFIKPMKTN